MLWLGLSCPECGDTRDLSADDRGKLKAKHPVQCGNGHSFRREEGFLHWLLETGPFGSALMSCDTVFEGEIDLAELSKKGLVRQRLPKALQGSEISWRAPSDLTDSNRRQVKRIYVTTNADQVIAYSPRTVGSAPLDGLISFQVVGATDPQRLPGWRQVLAEAVVAYEEGRHNVAALLGNVAFETFYSSIADPILMTKGMPESVVQLLHSRIPLEDRLAKGFASPLGLPHLNDAPFWGEWKNRARRPRNALAHRWVFDRDAKKTHASRDDARLLLFLHLKALCHLNPACFDWLLKLEAKKMAPQ